MSYDPDNIFAKILRGEAPAHRVFEDEQTLAFMDVMPAAPGHTLVIPKIEAIDLFDMTDEALAATWSTVRRVGAAVKKAFGAEGIRTFQLSGAAAGQTVFHYHAHVLPWGEGVQNASHGGQMADPDVLSHHAKQIIAALT